KGMITIESKIIHRPDLLIIGINSGAGAYTVLNNPSRTTGGVVFPERMLNNEDYMGKLDIVLFGKGNARGEHKGGTWYGYNWYDRNHKINNPFVARMIDLFIVLAETQLNKKFDPKSASSVNEFREKITEMVMVTNINPI